MIKLNVEEYCHDCTRFEPMVEGTFMSNNMVCQQLVECTHRRECSAMMRYLERKFKKELEDA